MVEELYQEFYAELLRYCRRMSAGAGEDLVQETYFRALAHQEELLELSRGQRRAWLYQTARHLAIDQARKAARESCVEQGDLDASPFEEDFTGAAVWQAVSRLPEPERTLFHMRYFQGYNATELGEIFNMKPSTVRARLASARRRLRGLWED